MTSPRKEQFWAGFWAALFLLLVGWLCWLSATSVSHAEALSANEKRVDGCEALFGTQLTDIQRRLERIEKKLDGQQ